MIERLTPVDPPYPTALRTFPDRPDPLWVSGSIPESPGVAIVGSRSCTAYGRRWSFDLAASLAAHGWTIVSGMARGIDAAAHQGALQGGGFTVGVLGCGIDVDYPKGHRPLAERIVASGGALISEYPPGTRPAPWRFPPRNRIISALAAAVIVLEASVKSGALITARFAAEQGRLVLALPGDLDRLTSQGANSLIRDGAVPVLGVEETIEALEFEMAVSTSMSPPGT